MKKDLRIFISALLVVVAAWAQPAPAEDNNSDGSAKTPPEDKPAVESLNVALVLDVSLSMDPNWEPNAKAGRDPLDALQRAALSFLGALGNDDSLAIVSFARDAVVETKLSRMDETARSLAARKLRGLKTREATNFAAALRAGLQELAGIKGKRVILFLSDGTPNTPDATEHEKVLPELAKEGVPVYAVGFEGEADWKRLEVIAEKTSGKFYRADETDLPEIFGRVQAQSRGLSELLGRIGFVHKRAEKKEIAFQIPDGRGQLRVFLAWTGKNNALELALKDPEGQAVTLLTAGVMHDLEQAASTRTVTVRYPAPGEWKALVTAKEIPPIGEMFRLSVQIDLSSPTEWAPFSSSYRAGETVRAAFVEATRKGGTLKAGISDPVGAMTPIELNDDGTKGDEQPADGIFTGEFEGLARGIHRVAVRVPGITQGTEIEVSSDFSCGTEEELLEMYKKRE